MVYQCVAPSGLIPFYLRWQLNPQNSNYNLCFSYSFSDYDKVHILLEQLKILTQLKPYLRQTFNYESDVLFIYIHDDLSPRITFLNSSTSNFSAIEDRLIKESHNINLESSINVTVINLEDSKKWIVLFNIHHIIMDGISLDFFITDLNRLINNKSVKKEKTKNYISELTLENCKVEHTIERKNVIDYIREVNLISSDIYLSFPSNNQDSFHYNAVLSDNIFQNLKRLSAYCSISIFNLLLLTQALFVSKLFNQNHSLINYPINSRQNKKLSGCFVNLMMLPLKSNMEDTYLILIRRLKKKLCIFKDISTSKFDKLPFIESIPSFANSAIAKPLNLDIGGESFVAETYQQIATSIFNIKYQLREDKLFFTCDVMASLFPKYLADTLLIRFFNYLDKLLVDPSVPIINNDLTFAKEKHQLLHQFNSKVKFCFKNKTINQVFETEVDKNPSNIALLCEKSQMTYSMLNERANQLAHYLMSHYKIDLDTHVALFLDRTSSLIVAMIAILKIGGIYICFNPSIYHKRTADIIKDAQPKIIITNTYHEEKIIFVKNLLEDIHIISIDSKKIKTHLAKQPIYNLKNKISDSKLAHLTYTSGTTGFPKGVMIQHQNIISLVKNAGYIHISSSDTFAFLSDITFDATTFEVWGALLNGAKLFMPADRLTLLSDTNKLKKVLNYYHITILLLTKSLFDQLFCLDYTLFSHLQYLLIGGESLNKSLIAKLSASPYRPTHIINAYGPTENTTISTAYKINHHQLTPLLTVPIGTPLCNRTAYLLDKNLNLLPIGAVGELYVGGIGLAQGYWNNQKLTAQRFIINPFQTIEEKKYQNNDRLYKTGDLARMLPNGYLECFGRNDFQIKIRGYRIELAEIERALTSYPYIEQVAIIESKCITSHDSEELYLIAYYVASNPVDEAELREYLTQQLPEYMLPKMFVYLESLPRTSTGKLDRKALFSLQTVKKYDYISPKNDQEKQICEAFSEVLKIKKVSAEDDFFHIGGNSLKAIALIAILQAHFKIKLSDIFEKRTPITLAKYIVYSKNNLIDQIEKIKLLFNEKSVIPNYALFDEISKENSFSVIDAKKLLLKKPINNILLTGATGYLGCNLLNQLLYTTKHHLFLLIRAPSEEQAWQRLKKKFNFYFDKKLDSFYGSRLSIFNADIEKKELGLSESNYHKLLHTIDSIIHSAALTKHYGDYDKFYSANVQATINLLEFSQLTLLKDFHHISTISVVDNHSNSQHYLNEDTDTDADNRAINYIKTKYEAEKQVLHYRKRGVNTNIYRVGNLAFIFENLRAQENIEDSAFLNSIKCFLTLNVVAEEIGIEEISPVDLTAKAILKIFDRKILSNDIHHIFNPYLCNVARFISQMNNISLPTVNIVTIDNFLELIKKRLEKPNYQNSLLMRFLLHKGWLEGEHRSRLIHPILQQKTNNILKHLNFEWPVINKDKFECFIKENFFHNV